MNRHARRCACAHEGGGGVQFTAFRRKRSAAQAGTGPTMRSSSATGPQIAKQHASTTFELQHESLARNSETRFG